MSLTPRGPEPSDFMSVSVITLASLVSVSFSQLTHAAFPQSSFVCLFGSYNALVLHLELFI